MGDYNFSSIIQALSSIGIKKGQSVFVHSNLGFFGRPENVFNQTELCELFEKAFFEIIGKEGTLICPTFSYSFCRKEIFDVEETKGVCGIFSEFIRKKSTATRSIDANFSISAIGQKAQYFAENAPPHSFGKSSFWDKLLTSDGIICNLNFDSGSTFIHFVERELQVPYRWDKPFTGKLVNRGIEEERVFYHFVYDLAKTNHQPDFTKFDKESKDAGLTKQANLGKGTVLAISAKETFTFIKERLQDSPNFLIKGNL